MNAVETLRAARKLIEKPESWIQYFYFSAGAENDGTCSKCFCAVGAIYAAEQANVVLVDLADNPAMKALAEAIGKKSEGGIVNWNDAACRTHVEVLAAYDRAIALAEDAP